jgi:hypothetical protein
MAKMMLCYHQYCNTHKEALELATKLENKNPAFKTFIDVRFFFFLRSVSESLSVCQSLVVSVSFSYTLSVYLTLYQSLSVSLGHS